MAKVVRLDNVAATKVGSLLKSAKYYVADVATKIENGELVEVGKLIAGERELHKATAIAVAADGGKYVGLVCTPEIDKTKNSALPTEFVNDADSDIRVVILQKGDIYSIGSKTPIAGVDVKINANLVAEFQGTEVVMGITYNVYEVK